jgi:hypothetical protein
VRELGHEAAAHREPLALQQFRLRRLEPRLAVGELAVGARHLGDTRREGAPHGVERVGQARDLADRRAHERRAHVAGRQAVRGVGQGAHRAREAARGGGAQQHREQQRRRPAQQHHAAERGEARPGRA